MARSIVLLGTGNVAYHLTRHLSTNLSLALVVWGRREAATADLTAEFGVHTTTDITELPPQADLYILAVSDDAIVEVAAQLQGHVVPNALVVHTSGATPSTILAASFDHYGVFYPLQTFSRGREVEIKQVPFCLWSKYTTDYAILAELATKLSRTVLEVNDRQRQQLHLAAVFVNNFTNYLQYVSHSLLEEQDLLPNLLQPLLQETVAKLDTLSPQTAQTGPARRGDQATIERHLALLEKYPDWALLYELFSKQIKRLEKFVE